MSSQVVVTFSRGSEYEFNVSDAEIARCTREAAHHWLDEEWIDLDCIPTNPVGKILLLDKILGVAKYAGEKRFSGNSEWAREYACAVAALLERPSVRVDLGEYIVG